MIPRLEHREGDSGLGDQAVTLANLTLSDGQATTLLHHCSPGLEPARAGPSQQIQGQRRRHHGSAGPDRLFVIQERGADEFSYPDSWVEWIQESVLGTDIYDPTNGTVSRGDIWRTTKGNRSAAN